MYLMQEILQVANGRNGEAVKRLQWIHSLMQSQPGFVRAQIAQYLGNSMRHLVLRMWEDRESWDAFRATPEGSSYPQSRPEGLYAQQPCGRDWRLLQESNGRATGNFLVRSEFDVAHDRWDDYLTIRKAQDRIHREAGGFQYAWNFKELGEGDGALLLVRKTGREDHMVYVESMLKSQLRDTSPQGVSTPRGDYMEYYEIIDEVTP
ncbi:MAG: antibiotic biosynthesis monooxygenase [Chloroflexota bacterium]|nr:antibiotic biosynthesis monooxygenase [Chloroflexota bacterium]MDE2968577.1 antibiotic biosynthesis monooxygenase [Chloroflexota bacterium]